ncbi:MAG: hypothetical protein ACYTDT_11985 [Planctomycetota bacterium]|jgi:hypothetical protein
MHKAFVYSLAAFLILLSSVQPSDAQKKESEEEKAEREKMFGKSFGDQVEDAVDKGCDWLKKQQGIDPVDPKPVFGKFPENPPLYGSGTPHRYLIARTAFPIQALCKSGCFVEDPPIKKAMDWLRKNYKEDGVINRLQGNVGSTTYEDATVLNAVEAYYISAWEAKERRLKYGQTKKINGKKVKIKRWGTEDAGAKKKKKKKKKRNFKLSKDDEKLVKLAVKALEHRFRKAYGGGGWRYGPKGVGESKPLIDVSATQYAMLGLKAATRLGVGYNKSALFSMYHYYRGQQDADGPVVKAKVREDDPEPKKGKDKDPDKSTDWQPDKEYKARGWAYTRKDKHHDADDKTYGSMTAAAINALILIRDELVADPGQKTTRARRSAGAKLKKSATT